MPDGSSYQPAERRPIGSRETAWAHKIAGWLARRNVSPNLISVAGMIAGILAGAAFAITGHGMDPPGIWWIAGAVLVQLRLLANLFDGMVAIQCDRASAVGELYNEVPDRVSDAAILIGIGYAASSNPALGYIAACLAIFVAYLRAMGKVAGGEQDFCGPMAKPHRMFLVTVTGFYMGLAPKDWPRIVEWALLVIIAGCVLTAFRRLQRTARALKRAGGN